MRAARQPVDFTSGSFSEQSTWADSGDTESTSTAEATARPPLKVARVLHVKAPRHLAPCTGEYDLVLDQYPNGQPLWKKRRADRWLYSGTDGKWYIGGATSQNQGFHCASGFIVCNKAHHGVTPDRMFGPWEFGDGSDWFQDASIRITNSAQVESGSIHTAANR